MEPGLIPTLLSALRLLAQLRGRRGSMTADTEAAVRKAVEGAKQELKNQHFQGEDRLSDEVLAYFDREALAGEVVGVVLKGGVPEVSRLRDHFFEDENATTERWKQLKEPLSDFCRSLETGLKAEPQVGALLRHRETQEGLKAIQQAVEKMTAGKQRPTTELSEVIRLLERIADRGPPGGGVPRRDPLTNGERAYLKVLAKECDRLLLAEEYRGRTRNASARRASLANVYVPLQIRQSPSWEVVFERLEVPEDQRPGLREQLRSRGGRGEVEAAGAGEGLAGEELALRRGRDPDEYTLNPWLPEGMTLEEALRPAAPEEAVAHHRRLVLLGNTGSGKSSFVNHFAATQARMLTSGEPEAEESLFPLRLILGRWSRTIDPRSSPSMEEVQQALADQAESLDLERIKLRLHEPSTLVLFDGLDEVPARDAGGEGDDQAFDRRRWVLEAVEKFLAGYEHCRVLVTSRIKPYRESDYQVREVPVFELAPFDLPRVERFSELWYQESDRIGVLPENESPDACHQRLLDAVRGKPVLAEMSEAPLLLTMLARVNACSTLPEKRAELYSECVEQLLWEWERKKAKESGAGSLVALVEEPKPPLRRIDVEKVLWKLTYEAHGQAGRSAVTLSQGALQEALRTLHPAKSWDWAGRVVELMEKRSGLLVADGAGGFTFLHRSFQEYLAARGLLEKGNAAWQVRRLAEDHTWREVVVLACGYLGWRKDFSFVQGILAEMVAGEPPTEPAGWRRVSLAGEVWREAEEEVRSQGALGKEVASRIPDLLTPLMQHPDLPAAQRLEAGLLLADLGVLPEDLDAWVEIPADRLDYSFKIAKYPVTNSQYRRFVEAEGYEQHKAWWSEESRREILRFEKVVTGEERWPQGPRFENDRSLNRLTQPVVGVSWYEAVAYCAWLTEDLRRRDEIRDYEEVRLASWEEWVRAAGGWPQGTKCPWGGKFEAWRANTRESSLGQPTPVSMYPGGVSMEGVFDLAGNVWEWIAEKGELAGGAFYLDGRDVGAHSRDELHPWVRNHYFGFRCVLVHTSRDTGSPRRKWAVPPCAAAPRHATEMARPGPAGGSPSRPGINPRATDLRRLKPASGTRPSTFQAGFIWCRW